MFAAPCTKQNPVLIGQIFTLQSAMDCACHIKTVLLCNLCQIPVYISTGLFHKINLLLCFPPADITLVRSTPPGAATALAEVHHNVLSPKGRSGKRVNGSLNLECYWEEAKRIEQESPGIAEKPTSEYEDPKEDRETGE